MQRKVVRDDLELVHHLSGHAAFHAAMVPARNLMHCRRRAGLECPEPPSPGSHVPELRFALLRWFSSRGRPQSNAARFDNRQTAREKCQQVALAK
jgi:hypothetical protein